MSRRNHGIDRALARAQPLCYKHGRRAVSRLTCWSCGGRLPPCAPPAVSLSPEPGFAGRTFERVCLAGESAAVTLAGGGGAALLSRSFERVQRTAAAAVPCGQQPTAAHGQTPARLTRTGGTVMVKPGNQGVLNPARNPRGCCTNGRIGRSHVGSFLDYAIFIGC